MNDTWRKCQISCLISALDAGVSVNSENRCPNNGENGILKTSSITYGTFRPEESKVILEGELAKAKVSPQKNRILISRMNTPALVGASAYVEKDYPQLFLPDRIWQISPKKDTEFSVKWLSYLLASNKFRYKLSHLATGTSNSMKNIAKSDVLTLKIPLPSSDEQKNIARILERWDHAIDLTERLIAEKQERRKGLVQQLLTGNMRLPGFDGDWREVRLGDVFRNRTESGRTDLSLVAITADRGVIPRDEINRKDNSSADKSKYLRICSGDIGYNTMRMWQGVSGFSTLEGIVSPAYTIVTPKEEIDGEFMAIMFKFLPVVHLFCRYSQGLVSDTWNLKFRHFAEIKVTIPGETEQKAIAKVFKTIDREFDLLQAKADALREQKKGLMQQLLTGKIQVKPCNYPT